MACHEKNSGIYGYRRMTLHIRRSLQQDYNEKRIYRLMREELEISSTIRRKKKKYYKTKEEYSAENRLNRHFSSSYPGEKVLTDITEFSYGDQKKLYLCGMFDLFDRSLLSYCFSGRANTAFVLEALQEAYEKERKIHLLHSDRGSQFTSHRFRKKLEEQGTLHSMSRAGKCIDNGPMEGFWGNMKVEKYHLKKYETLEELQRDLEEYIRFYHEERMQKNLGGRTPLEYKENWLQLNVDNSTVY